jgi:hypothetical protein
LKNEQHLYIDYNFDHQMPLNETIKAIAIVYIFKSVLLRWANQYYGAKTFHPLAVSSTNTKSWSAEVAQWLKN